MIQLHIGPQTLVISVQEVFCAPDSHSAVISAGGQILPITAKIKARHIPTVALQKHVKEIKTCSSNISEMSLCLNINLNDLERGGQQWMAESVL